MQACADEKSEIKFTFYWLTSTVYKMCLSIIFTVICIKKKLTNQAAAIKYLWYLLAASESVTQVFEPRSSFSLQHWESVKNPVAGAHHPRDGGRGDRLLPRPGAVRALPQGCGASVGGGGGTQWHWAVQPVSGAPATLHRTGSGGTACLTRRHRALEGLPAPSPSLRTRGLHLKGHNHDSVVFSGCQRLCPGALLSRHVVAFLWIVGQ